MYYNVTLRGVLVTIVVVEITESVHLISKTAQFSENIVGQNCVVISFTNLSETFLSFRKIK
jgi:hypothetical protein